MTVGRSIYLLLPRAKTTFGDALTIQVLTHQVLRNLSLPLVSVGKELFLVIEQFFPRFRRKFVIRTLHDRIHWTGFGAESTVNALGHVNIVSCRTAGAILALFRVNRNGLRGACSFAKLAGNAAFLASRVAAQGVLPAEAGTQKSLFIRVIDRDLWFREYFSGQPKGAENFSEEKDSG